MSDETHDLKSVRLVVRGRVQGVWYRSWTQESALGLGLNGWVRNRRDGSVEILLSGAVSDVDEMIFRCRQGPSFAHVDDLELHDEEVQPQTGFEIHPTL